MFQGIHQTANKGFPQQDSNPQSNLSIALMESLLIALGSRDVKRVARAAKSIIFKIKNGLVEGNSTSTETVGQICSAMEAQLIIFQQSRPLSSEAIDACVLVCELLVSMIQEELVIRGDPRLASTLQALMILKEADSTICNRSQVLEAIRLISSIAVTQSVLPDLIDQQAAAAADQVMEDSWTYTVNAPQQSQRVQRSTRGAGAILYSSLLQYGWRFPIVKVSDADEKYLFDLEVKLKLKHDTALSTLLDAFSDFPASLLVQRVGLLHVLLDLAGAPFSFADFEQKPLGYHAYTALTCLHELFAKAVHERQVFEDGGMVTVSPRQQQEAGGNDGEEFKSAALDQAESIQQYRYPSTANTGHTSTGLLPPPTFSGLAFALVAAVMPLLVSSDTKLATLAARIFHIAMPHVLEGNGSSGHDQKKLSNVNCGRLRHLLSRFEQLLANVQFNELFATFWTLLRANVSEQDTPSSTQRIRMVEELSTTSIVFILLDCFLRYIGSLHPAWMQSYHTNEENPSLLSIGANTLRLLITLSSSANRVQVLFPHSSNVTTIDTILAKVDPVSSLQARTSAEHADNIILFQQLCSVQVDQEHFLGGNEAFEYLQDIVKRVEFTVPYLLTNLASNLEYIEVDILVHVMQAIEVFNVQSEYEDQVITFLQCQVASMFVLILSLGSDQHIERLVNDQVMKIILSTVNYRQRLCEDFVIAVLCEHILTHQATVSMLQLLLIILNTASERKDKLKSSLKWVKVVFWLLDQDTFRQEYLQFEQVLHHLERDDESQQQEKCWVMGLFHHKQPIRVESAIHLRRHFMQDRSSLFAPASTEDNRRLLLGGKTLDPFHPTSFLALNDMNASEERQPFDTNKRTQNRSKDKKAKKVFGHQDMQELCNIGFSNNLDIAVQLSALLQLRQMMSDDTELLHTADENWLHREVTTKAMMLIEDILFIDSGKKVDVDKLIKLRRVDCEYILACMQLVHFILIHRTHSSHTPDMHLFIKLMLLTQETLLEMPNTLCEGSKMIKQIAFLSAHLLHFQSFSAHNWGVEDSYDSVQSRFVLSDGRSLSASNDTAGVVVVPVFVIQSFSQPDVVNDQKTLILSDLMSSSSRGFVSSTSSTANTTSTAVVKRVYELNEPDQEEDKKKPSMTLVQNTLADLQSPPANSVHMAVVTTCYDFLLTAENHQQVYHTCCLLQSLSIYFGSSLDRMFVALNIDVITAVSKIITTLPRTRKDHFTFYHVLHFLNDHLNRLLLNASSESDDVSKYHRVIIAVAELCLPTISKLLISPAATVNSKNTATAFIDIRKAIETELLSLLKITTSFSSDHFAIGALLMTNTEYNLLRYIAFDKLLFTSDSSRIRSQCLKIIINLLQYDHQGAVLLRSVEPEDGYFAPLQRFIRIAKLLRSPDSFQEHSLVTLSLHAIMLFIHYEVNEHTMQLDQVRDGEFWSWLVRLLYDRRAEVRLLAVDTIRLLLPHTTPDTPQAPGEEGEEQKLFSWPPLEQLYHLTMDTYECSDIKAKCLLITMQYIALHNGANDDWIVPFPMIRFVECLDSLLHLDTSHVSYRGLLDILEVFRLLFTTPKGYTEDIMVLLRSLKVFPRLVGLLHEVDVKRQRLAARSLRFSSSRQIEEEAEERLSSVNTLFTKQEEEQKMATVLHESLLRFFLLLSHSQPKQFEEIILRSKLISHMTTIMTETLFGRDLISLRLELMLLTRILDLIMTMITQPQVFHTAIHSAQGFKMIESLIETVAKGLSKLYLIDEKDLKKDFLLQAFITKAMKCVALLTNDRKVMYHLNLHHGASQAATEEVGKESYYSPFYPFFQELLLLRRSFHHPTTFTMQMDLVMTLLLDRSVVSQGIFRSILGYDGDYDENVRFARGYIQGVIIAADEIKSPPATVTNGGIDKSNNSMTKKRTTSGNSRAGAAAGGGGGGDENTAISSNASTVPFLLDSKIRRPHSSTASIAPSSAVSSSFASSNAAGINKKNKLSTNKWREKTRSYSWRPAHAAAQDASSVNTAATNAKGMIQLSESTLRSLWISCLVLKQSLRLSVDLLEMDMTKKLCSALSTLLKYFAQYSLLSSMSSTSPDTDGNRVSAGQVAAAIASLLMSLLDGHYHPLTTSFLRQSSEEGNRTAYIISKSATDTQQQAGLLHFLVSLGVNNGVIPAARWLCLSMLPGLLNTPSLQLFTPTVKVSLSHVIAVHLQRILKQLPIDHDAVFHFLSALVAFLSPDRSGVSCYSQFTHDRDVTHMHLSPLLKMGQQKERAEIVLKEKELTIMSFPSLLLWIRERCGNDDINILNLLCKCIGRLVDVSGGSANGSSFATSEVISFLAEMTFLHSDHVLMTTAATALWMILLHSERAKAVLKQSAAAAWPEPSVTVRLQQMMEDTEEKGKSDNALNRALGAIQDILDM